MKTFCSEAKKDQTLKDEFKKDKECNCKEYGNCQGQFMKVFCIKRMLNNGTIKEENND